MPRIEVRAAERTASKEPGFMHWVPGSLLALRIYPAMWEVWDVSAHCPQRVGSILLKSSIEAWNFHIVTDWRRGELTIRLQHQTDLHQWRIAAQRKSSHLVIELERSSEPVQVIWRAKSDQTLSLNRKEAICLEGGKAAKLKPCDQRIEHRDPLDQRIFFGCHKAAQWTRIDQRCNLTELGPILYLAGQWAGQALLPMTKSQCSAGNKAIESAGLNKSDMLLPEAFERLWRTHFSRWAFPHWGDAERTGLAPLWQEPLSPLYIFVLISQWLLHRLFKEEGERLIFLPSLPAICHAGRVEKADCSFGQCTFKWSKKALKEISFTSSKSALVSLSFQKQIRCLRVRRIDRRHGAIYTLDQQGSLKLNVQCGRTYRIDKLSGHH